LEQKIRVGAVSYLNTKPLVYGFEKGLMAEQIVITSDYPAKVAAMLLTDEIDIGLIPVAVIPHLKEHYIISDYCIGASQAVASVCVFSEVPLKEITTILVDYQSRTSAALLKILLAQHWKIAPELIDTSNGYQQNIKGTTAGLVIGDRALQQRSHSTYIFDLAEAWQDMTGLPFVFAAWVANKKLPDDLVAAFNKATSLGLQHIAEIVDSIDFKSYDLYEYYTKNIDYKLDERKEKALALFLSLLKK
jgi:chorismate dehydratase